MIGVFMKKNLKKYEDIIALPRHISKKRPLMPIKDRAAQFAPFAAVVGHEKAVNEAARLTEARRELDPSEKVAIDRTLREVEARGFKDFDVDMVYFQEDHLKSGGEYIKKTGKIIKIDKYLRKIHMDEGTLVDLDEIFSLVIKPSKKKQTD